MLQVQNTTAGRQKVCKDEHVAKYATNRGFSPDWRFIKIQKTTNFTWFFTNEGLRFTIWANFVFTDFDLFTKNYCEKIIKKATWLHENATKFKPFKSKNLGVLQTNLVPTVYTYKGLYKDDDLVMAVFYNKEKGYRASHDAYILVMAYDGVFEMDTTYTINQLGVVCICSDDIRFDKNFDLFDIKKLK
jgi:hypothetical protein